MKPRVTSAICHTLVGKGDKVQRVNPHRVWVVSFDDGEYDEEWFDHFTTALRFAHHVGAGGSRWEFVS